MQALHNNDNRSLSAINTISYSRFKSPINLLSYIIRKCILWTYWVVNNNRTTKTIRVKCSCKFVYVIYIVVIILFNTTSTETRNLPQCRCSIHSSALFCGPLRFFIIPEFYSRIKQISKIFRTQYISYRHTIFLR